MRIIGGRLGGRKLLSFKADHIRPTTDRVKETIFNKIQMRIPETRVLDLFSGTGNLGIEAISRGASQVVAVEAHPKSLRILRSNLENLAIVDEVEVIRSDVFTFLKSYEGEAFDIIFIDPPFTEKWAHLVMETLKTSQVGREGTLAIIESAKKEVIQDSYRPYELLDRKEFGDKRVSFFERSK